jgi:hypothetical protein
MFTFQFFAGLTVTVHLLGAKETPICEHMPFLSHSTRFSDISWPAGFSATLLFGSPSAPASELDGPIFVEDVRRDGGSNC